MVLTPDPEGGWLTKPAATRRADPNPGLILYRFGADLFYANADRFADETRALIEGAPEPVRWFVVDAGAITDMDYSAARTLRDLLNELKARNVNVALGRVEPSLRSDMERHGIAAISAKSGSGPRCTARWRWPAAARRGGMEGPEAGERGGQVVLRLVLSRFPNSVPPALGAHAGEHDEGSPAPLGQGPDMDGKREAPAIHSTAESVESSVAR